MVTELSKRNYSRQQARKFIKSLYGDLKKTEVVHHVDHNPLNNDPNNLVIIDHKDHISYHMTGKRLIRKQTIRKIDALFNLYNAGIWIDV